MSSLLLFNSGSRIAQGVLKRLHNSGKYQRIVCADVYPNYWAVQRSLKDREELDIKEDGKTKIEDIKISERSDLIEAVENATHVVYVTHDYYSLAPTKSNLIKTTADVAKRNKNLQRLVCLTPVEYNHHGELKEIDQAEKRAKEDYPDLVHLKSDIVAGEHGGLVTEIVRKIINYQPVHFAPRNVQDKTAPIHCDDVELAVENALKEDKHKGKSYLLQGSEEMTLKEFFTLIENACGTTAKQGSGLSSIISPTGTNLLSERLYSPEYIHLASFFKNYQAISKEEFKGITDLNIKPKSIKQEYSKSIDADKYREESSLLASLIKSHLY